LAVFERHLVNERGRSPQTVVAYLSDCRQFSDWCRNFGIESAEEVTQTVVRRFIADLDRQGYARSSISRKSSSLRRWFQTLTRKELLSSDPTSRLGTRAGGRRLPKVLRIDQVEQLLEAASQDGSENADGVGIRDRAVIELLYGAGARVSEVANLNSEALDLALMQVHLFGKGSKERLVPLGEPATDALARWVHEARPLFLRQWCEADGPHYSLYCR
jgi:site-specific recombinase XerD